MIGQPISGPILCVKTLLFPEKLGAVINFKASQVWLQNFKYRRGIYKLKVAREYFLLMSEAANSFLKIYKTETKDYDPNLV